MREAPFERPRDALLHPAAQAIVEGVAQHAAQGAVRIDKRQARTLAGGGKRQDIEGEATGVQVRHGHDGIAGEHTQRRDELLGGPAAGEFQALDQRTVTGERIVAHPLHRLERQLKCRTVRAAH